MTVLPSRREKGASPDGEHVCEDSNTVIKASVNSVILQEAQGKTKQPKHARIVELLSCWVVELRPVIFLPPFTSHNAHFWLSAAELKIVHTIWSAANNHTQWIHPMTKTWTTWCWFLHFFFLTSCLYQRFHVTHIWFLRFHRNSSVYTSNNLHAEGTSGCDRKWHIYTR